MMREYFFSIADVGAWQKYLPARRSVFGSLGYARICQGFRNVSARLYVIDSGEAAISYPLLFRPLADLSFPAETKAKWDASTPDFTGPLVSGSGWELATAFPAFRDALFEEEGVVAEFAHLHPWSQAPAILQQECDYDRDIVWVDARLSPEHLWRHHIRKQCRNQIRQAEREGVRTISASSDDHIREYHRIYSHTMTRNEAAASYYFSYEFFRAFYEELPENSTFLLAEYRDQIVAGALCLYDETDAYYFLAGTDAAFQHVRPANALVWELICWAHRAGKQRLILGGGYRPDDGIFHFKSNFSRLRRPFYVYKHVHLQQDYARLERRFREFSGLAAENVNYFPVYRHQAPAAKPDLVSTSAPLESGAGT
jgi:hypothetical protein